LLGDHLGSTALTVNSAGAKYGELRYKAFGETRYTFGTTPTSFAFTGQRQESGLGLYFYNARWYDPGLGRFIQADTVVPSFADPQSLNRFSYVGNNPLKYVDPSGHTKLCGAACEDELDKKWSPPKSSSGSGGGGGGNGPNGGWGPTIPVGPQGGSSGNVGDVPTESQSEGDHDEPCNPTSCNPSYMSLSIGIDLPTVIMGTGALISLADGLVPAFDSVGLPIVLVGALLETCAGTGIPLCVAIKLTSIGGVATVDDYGNVYAGPQLSFGKSVTPFIGGEFDMGFIINGDGRHASEDTTEKFLSGFSVSGGTIATGGIAYSPSLNKSAYYMVGLPSLGSINASYTWMIYDNP
jgi:RHS repeat-associated protein